MKMVKRGTGVVSPPPILFKKHVRILHLHLHLHLRLRLLRKLHRMIMLYI